LLSARYIQNVHDERARQVARVCVEALVRAVSPGYVSYGGASAGLRLLGSSEHWGKVQHQAYAEAAARECSVTGAQWPADVTLRGEEVASSAWLQKRIWQEDDSMYLVEALHILAFTGMACLAADLWCSRRRRQTPLEGVPK